MIRHCCPPNAPSPAFGPASAAVFILSWRRKGYEARRLAPNRVCHPRNRMPALMLTAPPGSIKCHDRSTRSPKTIKAMDSSMAPTTPDMTVDWDIPIPMDDGLVLRADVFRPAAAGRYPVILGYGPYGKGLAFQDG